MTGGQKGDMTGGQKGDMTGGLTGGLSNVERLIINDLNV